MTGTVLRRKAYDKLLDWKDKSNGSSAVLIDGSRRVGKTFLATEFAKNNYRSYILIDFNIASDTIKNAFNDLLYDLDSFFQVISVNMGVQLFRRDSVIILDEVQAFPRAREAVKYLVADGRYDYIETGSLLSIKRNVQDITIPSEEDRLFLNPLDFEEFLWAIGDTVTMPFIRECFESLTPAGSVHKTILDRYRRYILVGGMPQAVLRYVETKDFSETEAVKRKIVDLYREDSAKYAGRYAAKVRDVFDGIPSQLSRKDREFRITSLSTNARNRDYEDAFMWLDDGRIVNQCYNATDPTVGLSMYEDRARHKLYMSDTGLLVTMALADRTAVGSDIYMDLLSGRMGINEGMFMENVVAQELHSSGHRLFYFSRNDPETGRNEIEVDFLIQRDGKICPVEVKSSDRITHASLDKFVSRYGKRIGQPYILCTRDVQFKDGIAILPIYMASLLRYHIQNSRWRLNGIQERTSMNSSTSRTVFSMHCH